MALRAKLLEMALEAKISDDKAGHSVEKGGENSLARIPIQSVYKMKMS